MKHCFFSNCKKALVGKLSLSQAPNHSLKISPKKYTLRHWQITHWQYYKLKDRVKHTWQEDILKCKHHGRSPSFSLSNRRLVCPWWRLKDEDRECFHPNSPSSSFVRNRIVYKQHKHWCKHSTSSASRPPATTRETLSERLVLLFLINQLQVQYSTGSHDGINTFFLSFPLWHDECWEADTKSMSVRDPFWHKMTKSSKHFFLTLATGSFNPQKRFFSNSTSVTDTHKTVVMETCGYGYTRQPIIWHFHIFIVGLTVENSVVEAPSNDPKNWRQRGDWKEQLLCVRTSILDEVDSGGCWQKQYVSSKIPITHHWTKFPRTTRPEEARCVTAGPSCLKAQPDCCVSLLVKFSPKLTQSHSVDFSSMKHQHTRHNNCLQPYYPAAHKVYDTWTSTQRNIKTKQQVKMWNNMSEICS